jgi:DNA helicase-2/ATP-dependent DNA helicase PcrA
MITFKEFLRAHKESLGFLPDSEKIDAIGAGPGATLYMVAGPGTGKTACLAARVLKLMFVDDVPANGIIATTFTVKAAAELRSRILDWGFRMARRLEEDDRLSQSKRGAAGCLDVNQLVTGTIDSLCQDMLVRYRDPGTQPPVLIDEFVSRTLLLQNGLFSGGRFRSRRLNDLLFDLDARSSTFGWHLGAKTDVLSAVADRLIHDQIDLKKYGKRGSADERYAKQKLLEGVESYWEALDDRLMLDYARLEHEALSRLEAGELTGFLDGVQAVLVDEYQDTNLLQEQIYFRLASACDGALTVVGDDDQSLFRFRGATVELFAGFPDRAYGEGWKPQKVFLQTNYRSSRRIVHFVDNYARLDAAYQAVRALAKPKLKPRTDAAEGLPILGMFRSTVTDLSDDLADLIRRVFAGRGFRLASGERISVGRAGGAVGDAALLCSSPREANASGPLLPGLLRTALRAVTPAIEVFNPRGEALQDVPVVSAFAGTLLKCLDPTGRIGQAIFLPPDARDTFVQWGVAAGTDVPRRARRLGQIVKGWATRDSHATQWPKRVSALELVYTIAYFFPELHDDPEGQVYLEAFTRQLSASEQVSGFGGRILIEPNGKPDAKGLNLADHSVSALLRDFLGPIAAGSVDVNEDLIEDLPRDRLAVLSIHQAKGLEFPLTIVDVGSSFKTNHHAHRFKRFPNRGGAPEAMEDHFRPFSPLSAPVRSSLDRAFDDLYRQFFVAFSRARDILILVGLTTAAPGGNIENVAVGWRRDGSCPWASRRPFELL